MNAPDHPPPEPHGAMEQVFEDVFHVAGSIVVTSVAADQRINRNMVILRDGKTGAGSNELTLINCVRLDEDGEAALTALGPVKHVIRLGPMHGQDDRYYIERFGASFWRQEVSPVYPDPQPTPGCVLIESGPVPVSNAELFVFHLPKVPECALLLKREGGILITADSLQHHSSWEGMSEAAIPRLQAAGFELGTIVGPIWKVRLTPDGGSLKPDFERLLELDFEHHVSAHGQFCRGGAHKLAEQAVQKAFEYEA